MHDIHKATIVFHHCSVERSAAMRSSSRPRSLINRDATVAAGERTSLASAAAATVDVRLGVSGATSETDDEVNVATDSLLVASVDDGSAVGDTNLGRAGAGVSVGKRIET